MKAFLIFSIAALYFTIQVLTLSDYGIIWDEPDHFYRGQAYLNYYLTGSEDYSNLKDVKRSFYQDDRYTAEFYLFKDEGHPALNGILAALGNYIFYQKLNILGDIESLHLFSVLASTILVVAVGLFALRTYGFFAALVAMISLASYPLFFSEAHFNVKDPALAAFFGLTIWLFWESLNKFKTKWLFFAVVSFALGLSIKFNMVFLPIILGIYIWKRFGLKFFKMIPRNYAVLLILSPIIILTIFILCWPYLWKDLGGLLNVTAFYLERGVTQEVEAGIFLPGKINIYPIIWIFVTTPPIVLILSIVGIFAAIKSKRQDQVALLWLIWLLVTILRVTVPFSRTYGGVRQIMEYIPVLALLAGLGAYYLKNKVKSLIVSVLILLLFVPHFMTLAKIHPNENVYFNFLIGGIQGAKDKNIPYWGNSFGNAYLQGIWWLNKNAEPNAKLALLQKVDTNIAKIMLRPDINYYAGNNRSGIFREGEYIIELTHQGAMHRYPYVWEYVNKFLNPVYEVNVDGAVIAKVWKNDLQHTKQKYLFEQKYVPAKLTILSPVVLIIETDPPVLLSKLETVFLDKNCSALMGIVETSLDGKKYIREDEPLHAEQLPSKYLSPDQGNYYFAAREARKIRVTLDKPNKCLDKIKFNIYAFQQ